MSKKPNRVVVVRPSSNENEGVIQMPDCVETGSFWKRTVEDECKRVVFEKV